MNLLCAKDEDPRHRTKEPAGVRLCLSPDVAAASSTCGAFSLMHRSHDRRLNLHCARDEVPEQTEEPALPEGGNAPLVETGILDTQTLQPFLEGHQGCV